MQESESTYAEPFENLIESLAQWRQRIEAFLVPGEPNESRLDIPKRHKKHEIITKHIVDIECWSEICDAIRLEVRSPREGATTFRPNVTALPATLRH